MPLNVTRYFNHIPQILGVSPYHYTLKNLQRTNTVECYEIFKSRFALEHRYTFVLSTQEGPMYGSCLKFYEPMDSKTVMELEALKMAYEIGLQSTRDLPTEEALKRIIQEEYELFMKNDDIDCFEERVRGVVR